MYEFNAEKEIDNIVNEIKKWFSINGPNCNAVIGISGGKDSTVVAALLVKALGKDRVIGVTMPFGEQPDIEDSNEIIKYLGIRSYEINIKPAYDALISSMPFAITEQTEINIKPRLRMSTLYAVSQSNNGRVINTTNASEAYVGYGTRWGDCVGDLAVIKSYTCSEVIEIGHALNLPSHLVDKTPSDGLSGKSDEDNLGVKYKDIDSLMRGERIDDNEASKINKLHNKNLFKNYMPFVINKCKD